MKGRPVFLYECYDDIHGVWMTVIDRAGIQRLTPHCCRHGFATELLRNGVDVFTVARLGGWKEPAQVIKTYGHANKDIRLTDVLVRARIDTSSAQNDGNARKTGTS
jgi:integrase